MPSRNYKFYIRRAHRYLGIFIGVQFLLWTVGGIYFTWTDIDEIHGDHLRGAHSPVVISENLLAPDVVANKVRSSAGDAEIKSLRLITIEHSPYYEFAFETSDRKKFLIAADARTGEIRPKFTREEAEKIAVNALAHPFAVRSTEFLSPENVGKHHEYREKPLPAWAVTFENDLVVYVSAQTGQIGAFRTLKWRIFDFLWMLHTMDYQGRDDFNNYLIRGFSILGIITIASGFALFFVSSKFFGRRRRRASQPRA